MRVILCPNLNRSDNIDYAVGVATLLKDNGSSPVFCPMYGDNPLPELPGYNWSTIESEKAHADYLIVFGGDGALLRAARLVADAELPIIAINLGHLGFISELAPDDYASLHKLVSGNFDTVSRMMLDIRLLRAGRTLFEDFALNDVEIKGISRVISLEISGDGAVMLNYTGDGVVVATPTGSTAYSMSAGGPIVEPDTQNIIVTPICPHMLAARSFVLSPQRVVHVRLTDERDNPAGLSIDGTGNVQLQTNDIIEITMSEKHTRLIHLTDRSFYSTVFEKLGDRV